METCIESKTPRGLQLYRVIYALSLTVGLFSCGGGVASESLPEAIAGKAQVYDGVTFDLVQDGGRYRTAARIRLEAVDSCELRQKARLGTVDWPCGAVATAWLTSRTLVRKVECRPTRVLQGGGYRAQCYVDGTDIAAAGLEEGCLSWQCRRRSILRPAIVRLRPGQRLQAPAFGRVFSRCRPNGGVHTAHIILLHLSDDDRCLDARTERNTRCQRVANTAHCGVRESRLAAANCNPRRRQEGIKNSLTLILLQNGKNRA